MAGTCDSFFFFFSPWLFLLFRDFFSDLVGAGLALLALLKGGEGTRNGELLSREPYGSS
jgi:hypothetical protein